MITKYNTKTGFYNQGFKNESTNVMAMLKKQKIPTGVHRRDVRVGS